MFTSPEIVVLINIAIVMGARKGRGGGQEWPSYLGFYEQSQDVPFQRNLTTS